MVRYINNYNFYQKMSNETSNEIYKEVDTSIKFTSIDPEYVDKVNKMINLVLNDKHLTAKTLDGTTESWELEYIDIDYNVCDVCGKNEECRKVYCGITCCSQECFELAIKEDTSHLKTETCPCGIKCDKSKNIIKNGTKNYYCSRECYMS